MRIGVGLSTALEAWQAGVEAAAHARDQLAGETLSLAVLLASRAHTDEASAVLAGVHHILRVPALVGCVAQAAIF